MDVIFVSGGWNSIFKGEEDRLAEELDFWVVEGVVVVFSAVAATASDGVSSSCFSGVSSLRYMNRVFVFNR